MHTALSLRSYPQRQATGRAICLALESAHGGELHEAIVKGTPGPLLKNLTEQSSVRSANLNTHLLPWLPSASGLAVILPRVPL